MLILYKGATAFMMAAAAVYVLTWPRPPDIYRPTVNIAGGDQPLITQTIVIPKAKAAAEYAASALNMVAASASLAGAICVTMHSNTCSTLAFVLSGATWTMSGAATQTAIELGDPDFQKVVTPEGPAVDTSHLSASTKPMVTALLKAIALANALDLSARRLIAAAHDDSKDWVDIQSQAIVRLEGALGGALSEVKAEVVKFASDLDPANAFVQSESVGIGSRLREMDSALASKLDQAKLYIEVQKVEFALSCLEPRSTSLVDRLHRELCRAAVRSFMR